MSVYWIWLSQHPELTEQEKQTLAKCCPSPEDLYFPDREGPWAEELAETVRKARGFRDLQTAEKIMGVCARGSIRILTLGDEDYPRRLKNIPDSPLVLYYKGILPDLDALPTIGVVGTRQASAYGVSTARQLGFQIVRCGGAVVSGMAVGIDAAAMGGAIQAGGPVVGVLGCGPDRIYPRANRVLFDAMKDHCILSEYPPGTPPHKWNFPRRNRIISGLSSGVLVVEAPERSGSLITAHQAAEQGRDVFAVPGNVDLPGFTGSCQLLREGAVPVSSGWDVICEYERLYPGKLRADMSSVPVAMPRTEAQAPVKSDPKPSRQVLPPKKDIDKAPLRPYIDLNETLPKLSEDERTLVEALRDGPRQADDVIAGTGMTTGRFLAAMTTLEIRGIVKRLPGKIVQLK